MNFGGIYYMCAFIIHFMNIASPNEKKRYFSLTAVL